MERQPRRGRCTRLLRAGVSPRAWVGAGGSSQLGVAGQSTHGGERRLSGPQGCAFSTLPPLLCAPRISKCPQMCCAWQGPGPGQVVFRGCCLQQHPTAGPWVSPARQPQGRMEAGEARGQAAPQRWGLAGPGLFLWCLQCPGVLGTSWKPSWTSQMW